MKNDDLLRLWPEAERILDRLMDLPPDERRARAEAACAGQPRVWAAVERLLVKADDEHELALPDELADDIDDTWPLPPAAVGPYRILDELGRGGMSRVFRAVREGGPAMPPVALKLLERWPGETERRRFDRERDSLMRLRHPNVAALIDGGTTDGGMPYLVMELVAGRPIDEYLRPASARHRGPTPTVRAGVHRRSVCTRTTHRASRHQARQRIRGRPWHCQAARLRDRQVARRRRPGCGHRHLPAAAHAGPCRARAVPRRAGHGSNRRLPAGVAALPGAGRCRGHRPYARLVG